MLRLAAQLYTVRDFTTTVQGFEDVLALCHGIGYDGVQLSAVGCMNGEAPQVDAATAREMLDAHGLECCATHRPWDRLRDRIAEEIDFHRTLRCDYAAIGGVWDGPGEAPYLAWLEAARPVIAQLKESGIRFGYHNHSHEFIRDPAGGRPGYEVLIADGGPDLMMEVDTYWIAHAGADPAEVLRRCAGRIPVIHVKDCEVVANAGPVMAPVGEGNLNWPAILAACAAGGTDWLVVEQDTCRRDPFDCLNSSFQYLAAKIEEFA